MTIESLIIASAVALWFANGWYLNTRLNAVHRKLDAALEALAAISEATVRPELPSMVDRPDLVSE